MIEFETAVFHLEGGCFLTHRELRKIANVNRTSRFCKFGTATDWLALAFCYHAKRDAVSCSDEMWRLLYFRDMSVRLRIFGWILL